MKILFFNPEQYIDYEDEPSNYELRLPILNCGLVSSHKDFVYQRVLRTKGRKTMTHQALQLALDFKPDLVVFSTTTMDGHFVNGRIYRSIGGPILSQIMKNDIPVYVHVWDTYYIHRRPRELEWFLNCSYFGVAESVTNYLRYRSLLPYSKAKGVIFTPGHNVFTDIIQKKPLKKIYDVTLLGSNEGQRIQLTEYLKKNLPDRGISFHKFGGLIDSGKPFPSKGLRLTDQWMPWEDYVNVINQSKICLSSQTQPDRCQIKGKVFDILACGTLCMSDFNSELNRIVPDDCIVSYNNFEDCLNKITYYMEHEDERIQIADTGYKWFHSTFDYKGFWSDFLRSVINGDTGLPTLPIIEAEFDHFQRKEKKPVTITERYGMKPFELRVILPFLNMKFSGRYFLWKTLKTIEKLVGSQKYNTIKRWCYRLVFRETKND